LSDDRPTYVSHSRTATEGWKELSVLQPYSGSRCGLLDPPSTEQTPSSGSNQINHARCAAPASQSGGRAWRYAPCTQLFGPVTGRARPGFRAQATWGGGSWPPGPVISLLKPSIVASGSMPPGNILFGVITPGIQRTRPLLFLLGITILYTIEAIASGSWSEDSVEQ